MARMAEISAIDPAKKKDQAVMGALKQQKGVTEGGNKKSSQIIKEVFQREAPGQNINQLMSIVATLVKDPSTKLLQIGNTVFIVQIVGNRVARFYTFSQEPLNVLMDRYIAAAKTLKSQGFQKVIVSVDSPAYTRLAEQIRQKSGLNISVKPAPKMKNGQVIPAAQIEVNL